MAEIDNTPPIGPAWPQRPLRPIDDKEKSQQPPRQPQKKQPPKKDKPTRDDGTGIDEYA